MADIQVYHAALRGTLSPDQAVRMKSELDVKAVQKLPGFLPMALQVAVQEQDVAIRMASAITFKNFVRSHWAGSSVVVPDADRDQCKQMMVASIVAVPQNLRPQLCLALHFMLVHDFPEQWPNFIEQVGHFVQQTQNTSAVYGGLLALQEVIKAFAWKTGKDRNPLVKIVKTVFPYLLQIATDLVQHDSEEAASMLKVICKSYFGSMQSQLSKSHMDPNNLAGWCQLFVAVISKPIPDAVFGPHADASDKAQHPWWKAKKWAFHVLNKYFTRYGNSKLETFSTDKKYKTFAPMFMAQYAPTILNTYLNITQQAIQHGTFVSPRVVYLMTSFYAAAIKHKDTWAILKTHVPMLIQHVVHPYLCISADDLALWTDDPVEYVHAHKDPLEDFRSPTAGCQQLLLELAVGRRAATFDQIMAFIHQVVVAHAQQPTPQTANQKDGALHMLLMLADVALSPKSSVRNDMETFLVNYVFPEFASPAKYLRARALQTVAAFSELEYANSQHALRALEAALAAIQDTDLPLRIEAGLALKPMIANDVAREAMAPHIPAIMQALLDMQNQIDMDMLATVMEEMVEVFSEQVAPFAVQLAQQLAATFVRIMDDAQAGIDAFEPTNDDDFDFDAATDKTMAAMGVLKTMQTLVLSVDGSKDIMLQLETTIAPVLCYVLDHQIIDLYGDVFELIDSCTYSLKEVSPCMWSMFDKIYRVSKTDASDFVCEMVPCLDNYISYGTREFAANVQLQQAMVDLINICMTTADLGEADRVCGCQLMESMMLHLRGHIDAYLPHFISLAVAQLAQKIKTNHLRVSTLEVVINAIYYNPPLALHILEENHWTTAVFDQWARSVAAFSRVHDKKLCIAGICALLAVPHAQLPAVVQQGLPQIMAMAAAVFQSLPKALENRSEQERFFSGIDEASDVDAFDVPDEIVDDDGADGFEDIVDDDDDAGFVDEDDEELMHLAAAARRANGGDASDAESDDDDDDEIPEEMYFDSPLDAFEPYGAFTATFQALEAQNPATYAGLTAGISAETHQVVVAVMQKAVEIQQQEAANAAAAAAAAGTVQA
ncbi:hypothetical protein AMAG_05202 [Allomyces macrogynus ATCC 38327]|uniref:Importin N-terminal domain-containing protein n=1 Tax=Allomyces macrogynus (strain ATCC 38327) TaxID=578462 RepID=A0A0L0SBC3_ALLM3|nr:hypothetical protein AMAG_05202 [Allomyces macrogynus ATCC 38327]|eukprot:KNE59737.1 hypothetical protein AMAG_05202 [Allomyces macrogynus ATCC 38327]